MAARGLSLYKLAKDTGVHRNTLRTLLRNEAKQYDAGLLDLLCRYFECPIEGLISFNKDEASVRLKRPGAGKVKSSTDIESASAPATPEVDTTPAIPAPTAPARPRSPKSPTRTPSAQLDAFADPDAE